MSPKSPIHDHPRSKAPSKYSEENQTKVERQNSKSAFTQEEYRFDFVTGDFAPNAG